MLPDGLGIDLDTSAWRRPEVFGWLQESGGISEGEMLRTFNCGIGMTVLAAEGELDRLAARAREHGIECQLIGQVRAADDGPRVRYLS